jgi:enolase
MKIKAITAYQIFDSRGNPTIETELQLDNGVRGWGRVPSGASTGQFEALELRDGNPQRWRGKSVLGAIDNIEREIAPALAGCRVTDQRDIDQKLIALDGTANKSRLGGNAILGVSLAVADAAAQASGQPLFVYLGASQGHVLPLPEIQIIGGGAHANGRLDIQDYLLIANGASSYSEALEITFNVYHAAGDILRERGLYRGVADEGGYWPEFAANEEPLELIVEAIQRAGYVPGQDASISLDIAASNLFDAHTGRYIFPREHRDFSASELARFLIDWCDRYPIISLEDPMADTDWTGWTLVADALKDRVQLVGDDLFVTNLQRIEQGIERQIANAVLIKLNQVGTVSESMDAIRVTQRAGWRPIVSARSGETEDVFIAHLAVATNAGQLKVGSFSRSERMAKWNEVLRIERALGKRGTFPGGSLLKAP